MFGDLEIFNKNILQLLLGSIYYYPNPFTKSNKIYNYKTDIMKKVPIKVIVRMRPTANFAHQQLTADEQTGYLPANPAKSMCMSKDPSSLAS